MQGPSDPRDTTKKNAEGGITAVRHVTAKAGEVDVDA